MAQRCRAEPAAALAVHLMSSVPCALGLDMWQQGLSWFPRGRGAAGLASSITLRESGILSSSHAHYRPCVACSSNLHQPRGTGRACTLRAQEEALKAHADSARRRREAAEAAATPEDRVVMYAAKKDRAKVLQKQEVRLLGTPLSVHAISMYSSNRQ